MYEYTICNRADEEVFQKQCQAIEKNVNQLEKGKLLVDVDESKTQFYYRDGKKILVSNRYYENEVRVKSDVQLEQFFS